YRRLLEMFVHTDADVVSRIEAALEAGDRVAACRHAHSLKGVAATVGADELAAVAGTVEEDLRAAGDPHPAPEPPDAAVAARIGRPGCRGRRGAAPPARASRAAARPR